MSLQSISESLAHSVGGAPWHGPALGALLADVTDAEAAARPIAGAHSIAEIALHVTAWIEEVTARLAGRAPALPLSGDWPEARPWPVARAGLAEAHERLQRSLAALPGARLAERVGDLRDPRIGTGVTVETMLIGLAEHHAYHGGQVTLLKRALRAGRRED